MNKKDKKRVDLDTRPVGPWVQNYDYGGPEDGDDVSPGTGLYHGDMDKYDSVSDFLEQARKRKHRKRSLDYILELIKRANEEEIV